MSEINNAVLSRVTHDGLAYLVDRVSQKVFPFTFDKLPNYRGETVSELGLKPGKLVTYRVDADNRVTQVEVSQKPAKGHWFSAW